jgi:acetolactate synthase-1/2/3 large subunit
MKHSGARLLTYALEQVGVRHVFGIPGVHITEIYDELGKSETITPYLVTHEQCGAFMADAISRTSDELGCICVVPAAGLTQAMSGIGEAFLDGIPMLVIAGGTRNDTGFSYQLHQMDQAALMKPITKAQFKAVTQADVIPMIYEAANIARSGEPGPVFVEIPVEISLFEGAAELKPYVPEIKKPVLDRDAIKKAAEMLVKAHQPGIFAGWGAREASDALVKLAEMINAPVSTTLQGQSVFPNTHPLFAGMGFSKAAVPAAEIAFDHVDVVLAIGTRFGEIPTGSFGIQAPEILIHIDINDAVFNKNYPAALTIHADAKDAVEALIEAISDWDFSPAHPELGKTLTQLKEEYTAEWKKHDSKGRVNPVAFFEALMTHAQPGMFLVVDDGNHTFLTSELYRVTKSKHMISPTDFNCMGYATPAAIGVKLAHPDKQVSAIVGDGAFAMTCMEIATAAENNLGVVFFVFSDGELSQISQGQQKPYSRKTATILPEFDFYGVATATGAAYLRMETDADADAMVVEAFETAAGGRPVIVDVNIDYSKETRFTAGVVKTNLSRFPLKEKLRFLTRAAWRKVTG